MSLLTRSLYHLSTSSEHPFSGTSGLRSIKMADENRPITHEDPLEERKTWATKSVCYYPCFSSSDEEESIEDEHHYEKSDSDDLVPGDRKVWDSKFITAPISSGSNDIEEQYEGGNEAMGRKSDFYINTRETGRKRVKYPASLSVYNTDNHTKKFDAFGRELRGATPDDMDNEMTFGAKPDDNENEEFPISIEKSYTSGYKADDVNEYDDLEDYETEEETDDVESDSYELTNNGELSEELQKCLSCAGYTSKLRPILPRQVAKEDQFKDCEPGFDNLINLCADCWLLYTADPFTGNRVILPTDIGLLITWEECDYEFRKSQWKAKGIKIPRNEMPVSAYTGGYSIYCMHLHACNERCFNKHRSPWFTFPFLPTVPFQFFGAFLERASLSMGLFTKRHPVPMELRREFSELIALYGRPDPWDIMSHKFTDEEIIDGPIEMETQEVKQPVKTYEKLTFNFKRPLVLDDDEEEDTTAAEQTPTKKVKIDDRKPILHLRGGKKLDRGYFD